ncbi:hypothetical protein N802_09510 [Knoellia sinensis KCTC 19936]|uniref:AbiEi antitoxin C-terminal domain-containing protein n=1 Tax=Knoellia sinensis KCTC 19936 TaxID=1385520 RepID=A0A0A0J227_9MICO|nr:hypothetical protein N802_09510 [Knoellia sinensis KCTC 19936]
MRTGVWVPTSAHTELLPVDRHAALVHATALTHRRGEHLVFVADSAAAVLGLPRITAWPSVVRHLVNRRGVSGSAVLRPLLGRPTEYLVVNGVRVSTPARTVVDLARHGTLEDAVTAADYCLRHVLCTPVELNAELALVPAGAPGRARARTVVELADGLSMSPGESFSRVLMFRHRIPKPRLQMTFTDDAGHVGDADFWWEGVVGEFDGQTKYRIPPGASHEEAGKVLWAEKKREDRLRRLAEVARWVWADLKRPERLLAILADKGIVPERNSTWIDLGRRSGPV